MGLILDIVNNVVPKVQERVSKGEGLKKVLYEELEKEIAHSLTNQSIGNKRCKNNVNNIITDKEDIDNGEVYDIESGQTIRDLGGF
ncbi:hypothetical protein PMY12_14970 [Clostridium tertium]|jgi:hypothetical protein|uniref:hypothetical protein n=1 Tax=Clostridium tertium TaxID=1559 RepID=UPI00232C4760|nr:hypothetical protein [Clostridium tertium]MDB1932946.1 hypothetical protein [Clostridium tertium]MDB1938306.1 hypothetical protein [Clostridium tertium]